MKRVSIASTITMEETNLTSSLVQMTSEFERELGSDFCCIFGSVLNRDLVFPKGSLKSGIIKTKLAFKLSKAIPKTLL